MPVFLFCLLIIAIAYLSKPGRAPGLPKYEGTLAQRAVAVILMMVTVYMSLDVNPVWLTLGRSATIACLIIAVMVPFLASLIVKADQRGQQQAILIDPSKGRPMFLLYLGVTSMYMVIYEILLRGVLLYYLVARLDVVYAVLVNTIIYSLMHLTKDLKEALLGLPVGVFLCWLTLYTDSIWPAACFHLAMALSFEIRYSLRYKNVNS